MKRGAPDHWKMEDLARRAKVPSKYGIAWANGTMERLWHFTARYAIQGDIGKVPDTAIAKACGWPEKDAAVLIEALVGAKWLDRCNRYRLVVHDWQEHCDDSVRRTLKNNNLEYAFPENAGNVPADSSKFQPALAVAKAIAVAIALPEPEPGGVRADAATVQTLSDLALDVAEPEQPTADEPAPVEKKSPLPVSPIEEVWATFTEAAKAAGIDGSGDPRDRHTPFETDWGQARSKWKGLDGLARLSAIEYLSRLPDDSPVRRCLPQNYIARRMWERPIHADTPRNRGKPTIADAVEIGLAWNKAREGGGW